MMKGYWKRKLLVIGLLFLLFGASATLCVNAIGPWSDNFDSYTDGQLLDGTPDDGGWECWAANPAAYGTVTSDNYRSAPFSVDINGASDLIYRYGDTTGEWVYTAWQFIPEGQSGGNNGGTYFIMQDVYTNGGSDTHWAVQIQFDNINDCVESEFDTENPTLPLIYGEWVEIRVEINFDSDWFKFYYDNQLLIEKSWTSGLWNYMDGTLCLATVDLWADDSSTVYWDDMSWLPAGEELLCDAGGPYSGNIDEDIHFSGFASGGTEPYTWSWDFGDGETSDVQNPTHAYEEAGEYTATLTVTDAAEDTCTDTATVTIVAPAPVIEIGAITGGLLKVTAVIQNTGDADATDVDWSIAFDGGLILLGKETTGTAATIPAGGQVEVTSSLILGFGKTTITVSAGGDSKDQAATVLLIFIKI
jgi:hypothetical protein